MVARLDGFGSRPGFGVDRKTRAIRPLLTIASEDGVGSYVPLSVGAHSDSCDRWVVNLSEWK